MGNDGDNLDRPPPLDNLITREEYDGLFNAIVRLTDRIEALEAKLGPVEKPVLDEEGNFPL